MTTLTLLLQQIRSEMRLPALAGVILSHEAILDSAAVGVRNMDSDSPVAIHDYFQIGSNAKAMTATVCAVLVEKGILRWDITPPEVFPELAETISSDYQFVTLDLLLHHRAGIPPYTDTDGPDFILPDFDGVPPKAKVS